MPIPEKRADLIAMGYVFGNEAICRGCKEPIEWWITPNGKKMPMTVQEIRANPENAVSPVTDWIRVPHWGVCPNANDFRKASR